MPQRWRTQLSELDAKTVHSSSPQPYDITSSFPRLGAQRSTNALLRSVFPAGFTFSPNFSKRNSPHPCDIILDAATTVTVATPRDNYHRDNERNSRVSFGAIHRFKRIVPTPHHETSFTKQVLPTKVFTCPDVTLPPSTRTLARQCRPVLLRAIRRVEADESPPDAPLPQPNTLIATTPRHRASHHPETHALAPTHLKLWLPGAHSAASLSLYTDSMTHAGKNPCERRAAEEFIRPLGSSATGADGGNNVRRLSEITLGKLLVRIQHQHQHHYHSLHLEVAPGDVDFDSFRHVLVTGFVLENYIGPLHLSYLHPVTHDELRIQNQGDWQSAFELGFREGQGALDVMLRTLSTSAPHHDGRLTGIDAPAAHLPTYPLRWHFPLTARHLLTQLSCDPPASRQHDDRSRASIPTTLILSKDAHTLKRRRQRYAAELYSRLG